MLSAIETVGIADEKTRQSLTLLVQVLRTSEGDQFLSDPNCAQSFISTCPVFLPSY